MVVPVGRGARPLALRASSTSSAASPRVSFADVTDAGAPVRERRSTVPEAVEVSSGVTGPEDEREPEEDTEDDAQ